MEGAILISPNTVYSFQKTAQHVHSSLRTYYLARTGTIQYKRIVPNMYVCYPTRTALSNKCAYHIQIIVICTICKINN